MNLFHVNWQLLHQMSFRKHRIKEQPVLTFEQLRHEVSGHRSSRVIISWPCLLDGLPSYFTANKLAAALMMSSSDDQPTTAATPSLSKEALVRLNEVCNDCNESTDRVRVFDWLQRFPSQVGREKKTTKGELNSQNVKRCLACRSCTSVSLNLSDDYTLKQKKASAGFNQLTVKSS